MRSNRLRRLARKLLILLVAVLGVAAPHEIRAQETIETPVPFCPTGSMLTFPKPAERRVAGSQPEARVYIRREGSFDLRVWEAPTQDVILASNRSEGETQNGIGFVVPQLDRGRYVAWYGAADLEHAKDSLLFDAVPQLLVEEGIVRGRPYTVVTIQVRLASTQRLRQGTSTAETVSPLVSLAIANESLAQVVSTQAVRTDEQGIARWRVRIKKAGIGQVIASAEQFEPTVVELVGMPAEGEVFAEAQAKAQERRMEYERQESAKVASRDRARSEIRMEERAARIAGPETTLINQPRRIRETELEPGDVLLVLGSSYISDNIREFEQRQLTGRASYSHASLYLGEFGGVKMVGEMWGTGFWITPLPVSVAGTRLVDVYRASSATQAIRQELARRAANAFGDPSLFIRSKSPSFFSRGSILPYAFEQIGLLALASTGTGGVVFTIQNLVDPRAGGRRKMICSEYVAWAYHDGGLELDVPPWRVLSDLHLLDSHERRHDYTTPNMLANSRSLGFVGRYRGP